MDRGLSRRRLLIGTGMAAGALLASGTGRRAARGDWPVHRRDPGRSGAASGRGPATGTMRWSVRTVGELGAPVVDDGIVVTAGDAVVGRDPRTGEKVWQHDVALRGPTGPGVVDGLAIVAYRNSLVAVDTDDGTSRWDVTSSSWWYHAPAPGPGGNIYAGATRIRYGDDGDAAVLALDPADGRVRWRAPAGSGVSPPFVPSVAEGLVLVGRERLTALRADDGTVRWTFDTPEVSRFGDPVVVDGTVYVGVAVPTTGAPAGALLALDPTDGAERWRVPTGRPPAAPAVVGDTLVATADNVLAIDTRDGRIRWRVGDDRFATAPPSTDGLRAYVAGIDGTLAAFDIDDGTEVWRWTFPGSLATAPALADGGLFVGSATGYVVGVGP